MNTLKYVVLKDFLDRFDNKRHCKPGEPHVPPNEERAKQLVDLGFIAVVEEQAKSDQAPPEKPPKGKKQKGDGNGA